MLDSARALRLLYMSACLVTMLSACTPGRFANGNCSAPTDFQYQLRPTLANGVLYFGGELGTAYALRATTGKVLWHTTLEQGVLLSQPAIIGTVVLFATYSTLYGLDAATGKVRWHAAFTTFDYAATPVQLAASNDSIFVNNGDVIMAFRVADGAVVWTYANAALKPSYGRAATVPVLSGQRLYLSADGVYALDALTGQVLWHHKNTVRLMSYTTPLIVDETLYVTAQGDDYYPLSVTPPDKAPYLEALRVADGQPLWRTPTGRGLPSPPFAQGDALYTTSLQPAVVSAFDRQTGAPLWQTNTTDPSGLQVGMAPPLGNGDLLFVGGSQLTAVDLATHTKRWQVGATHPLAPGALDGDTLYVGIGGERDLACPSTISGPTNGDVEALRTSDGKRLWLASLDA